jgi:hypothetical protein
MSFRLGGPTLICVQTMKLVIKFNVYKKGKRVKHMCDNTINHDVQN